MMCHVHHVLFSGNDVISPESMPLIFVYLYPEENATANKTRTEKLLARKCCFM